MSNFFYIGARLCKIIISDKEKSEIEHLVKEIGNSELSQQHFFEYCKQWKIAPWIYCQLNKHGFLNHFMEKTQTDFKNIYEKVKSENEDRNAEALNFLREFQNQNIDVAILKGNVFIHTVYGETGYKKMNDFDMLVHQHDWPKIQKIYFDLGYIPLGFGWGGEKQKAAKFSHAGMSFISPNYQCITGTQWGLKSPTSKYKVDIAEAWRTALDFDFYGQKVKKLSPEYNLLHLVLHMGTYKCGIRDCMDVYNLLLDQKEFNEDKFVEIAKEANAGDKAYFTLKLTDICSGTISQSLIEKLKYKNKSFIISRLQSRLKMAERTGDFQLSYNDYFHNIEMDAFYFNIFPQFHKRLVIYFSLLKKLFWPKTAMVIKLSDLNINTTLPQKIKARLKAPYLAFGLLAEEIGLGISILLLLKLFFNMLVSVKNYIVPAESYFDYLKKLGINPDNVKKAVKQIQ